MIVAWDEEFASVKLYHDIKDVGVKPYEVIPIEDLLDAWEKQKAEQTEPNCSEKPNNCEDEFFRELTAEERKAVADYIDSISVPTGVNIFDLMDEPQTDCPWK